MPAVNFDALPEGARVWVFASDRPLNHDEAAVLLEAVDEFLGHWTAHGAPLRSARDWRDGRFLAIGVDPTAEQASGCSIDGLFRGLRELEKRLHTGLVAGGRIFYRDPDGQAQLALRRDLSSLAAAGALTADTSVFDTSVIDARSWRERFERSARDTWVGALLAPGQASQRSNRSATKASSASDG